MKRPGLGRCRFSGDVPSSYWELENVYYITVVDSFIMIGLICIVVIIPWVVQSLIVMVRVASIAVMTSSRRVLTQVTGAGVAAFPL